MWFNWPCYSLGIDLCLCLAKIVVYSLSLFASLSSSLASHFRFVWVLTHWMFHCSIIGWIRLDRELGNLQSLGMGKEWQWLCLGCKWTAESFNKEIQLNYPQFDRRHLSWSTGWGRAHHFGYWKQTVPFPHRSCWFLTMGYSHCCCHYRFGTQCSMCCMWYSR